MVLDWQNTCPQVEQARPSLAILPIGTTEVQGEHLPVGAVTIILEAVSRQVAERLPEPVYLLPVLPFGTSASHAGAPGTVALSWRTLMDVVTDLVESLLAQGIRRVAVINGLGGPAETMTRPRENDIVKTAVRQLNYDHPELDAVWMQPFTAAREELAQIMESPLDDLHAGELATSLLLHLAPELVQGAGQDCVPAVGPEYLDCVPFARLSPAGTWGRPSLATANKGERALEAAVERTARYIEETLAYLARAKGRAAEERGGRCAWT